MAIAFLLAASVSLPRLLSSATAQPMPTCSPGQSCKVLSLTATKTTGLGLGLSGDAGVHFGDGTIQNTAATAFSGFAASYVASAGANTMAFAAGDGGMFFYNADGTARAQWDGGFAGLNIVSGVYSQSPFLDTGSNTAFMYQGLTPAGAACATGNVASWYAGTTLVMSAGCNSTVTVSTLSSSADTIKSGTYQGRSSSNTTIFEGNKSDNASAVAIAFGNTSAYSTAGDELISWRNGSAASTEYGYTLPGGLTSLWTQHPVTGSGKRIGEYTINTIADTSFTATKLPAPTLNAAGVVAAAPTADGTLMMLDFPTLGVTNSDSAIIGPYTVTAFDYRPRLTAVIRTGASIANTRIFVGLSASDISGVATLAGLNGIKMVAVRYDTGLSDAQFQLVTSDGTTASANVCSSAIVAINTTYIIDLDFTKAGAVQCRINNGSNTSTNYVLKSTNTPTGTAGVGIQASATTLANSAIDFYIGKIALEQN